MIRMVQSVSAAHAQSYYSDALLKSDYYLEDQELGGAFRGRLAARLGLEGRASKEQFFALCENRNPVTGGALTPRKREGRTTGYDINFHVPKSVSVVHVLSSDDHILEAFQRSVSETMADIEADARTRIRKDGADAERRTGELLWVDFIHQTARPVKGHEPDPHLHAHCYVFNATWDSEERRCKAGQFRAIMRDMPYYKARFHKRLADRLTEQGYTIRRTKKSFEIEGVPQAAIDHFSKRTDEIGRIAQEKGITDAKALDALGAKTRAQKRKGLSMPELKTDWRRQIEALGLSQSEGAQAVRFGQVRSDKDLAPDQAVGFARQHHFERAAVLPSRKLLATAYTRCLGDLRATLQSIDDAFKADRELLHTEKDDQDVCTTTEVLKEERRMVQLAVAGRGKMTPLYGTAPAVKLAGEQGDAIRHLLTTADRVSIVRGAAGTGKTTLMREAVDWMEETGKQVTVLAPTSIAARDVLRGDGFGSAETVAQFLQDERLQDGIKNGVLWVDEAGLLGTRDMRDLLDVATRKNARLILGGDTRQHTSVERGDALRILSSVGKIKAAEVTKIHRQQNGAYRDAVEALAEGNTLKAFETLDGMGALIRVDPARPNATLAKDYVQAVRKGKTALALSPTNAHRRELTAAIREELRSEGLLGKKETAVNRLENRYLTVAEKNDWRTYQPGQVIQFVQNTSGIKRGSRWTVRGVATDAVEIGDGNGKTAALPLGRTTCFDVLEESTMPLAKGDRIKITRNGFDTEGRRLTNGQTLDVVAARKDRLLLRNPVSKQTYEVGRDFGHLDHAHCITSYSSQGKTVDEVFIAQPAATFPATNAKQFYVSASRARTGIRIYTDDKEQLLAHAQRDGHRTAALEIASGLKEHDRHLEMQQRGSYSAWAVAQQKQRDQQSPSPAPRGIDRDYEPGF